MNPNEEYINADGKAFNGNWSAVVVAILTVSALLIGGIVALIQSVM